MNKKSFLLRISLSIVALLFLYQKINLASVLDVIKNSNKLYLGLAMLMIAANYTISGFRWRSLIFFSTSFKGRGVLKLIKLYFIGAFFNNFMPTSIGGDVYKAYILGKNTNDLPKATAATFANRLSGLIILALFATTSLILLLGFWGILVFIAFWFLIVLGFVFLSIAAKLIKKLRPFNDALLLYKNHKKEFAMSLVFSFFVQIAANLAQYFAVKSVGINVTIPQAFFAFPVIGFLSFLPISFNRIGLQDWLYKRFFLLWGISPTLSVASSLLFHFCRIVVSLIGGVFLLIDHEKPRTIEKTI